MQQERTVYKIGVHPPTLKPKNTSIGYGNPRYNSMLVHKSGVLLSSGSHLRLANIKQNKIDFDRQIGCCQIFQIQQNSKYIYVVNYDGLITLLQKDTLEMVHQFYAPGKEIRHSTFTDKYLACSCELVNDSEDGFLIVYRIEDIEKGKYEPHYTSKGRFYFPQYCQDELVVLEYHDPNPKGRKRKETVMAQKLPITNQLLKFDKDFNVKFNYKVVDSGQMICCAQNQGVIYYLHTNKRMTVMDIKNEKVQVMAIQTKSFPHLVEPYKNGVVYPMAPNKLGHIKYDKNTQKTSFQIIEIKTQAIGGNLSLKFSEDGIYSLSESGLHFYSNLTHKTINHLIFNITNCSIAFNETGDLLAVADFGGSFFIFETNAQLKNPDPLFSIFIGLPIRSIAWCQHTNNLVLGCVGGSIYWWKFGQAQAQMVYNIEHTANIIRAVKEKFFIGSSDGKVLIFQAKSMTLLGQYKAHHPIHYQSEQDRQLFGSMKNYAQIWSLTIPQHKEELYIVSSCEDQSQKVYKCNLKQKKFEMQNHLKGHQLAVTSIDWQIMDEKIGQIYVSCSDDKKIRFRDPNNNFEVLFDVQTSTIKQWHTLTYLALEPKGHRVAVGSQNGYLFIFDLLKRQMIFAEKVHLGGIQGLDWRGNKICTCSSDLCVNIFEL